jgi:hypothetical protein
MRHGSFSELREILDALDGGPLAPREEVHRAERDGHQNPGPFVLSNQPPIFHFSPPIPDVFPPSFCKETQQWN